MIPEITEDTFLLYAAKHYNNPSCTTMKEFLDDIKRFKYIKRLFRRYTKNGKIADRLVLNHIIVLHNVFGPSTIPLLFFKIEKEYWAQLKTFLIFLDYLPDNYVIEAETEETVIPLDTTIISQLRKI